MKHLSGFQESKEAVLKGGVDGLRCTAVLNKELPLGKLANAAAVLALTMGQRHPELVGSPLIDGSGIEHCGLIPIGVPMLGSSAQRIINTRNNALNMGLDVVDFPVEGQSTKNYEEFARMVQAKPTDELEYLGIMILGPRHQVDQLVRKFSTLR